MYTVWCEFTSATYQGAPGLPNDAQGLIVEDVKQVQPLEEAIVLGILFLVLYIIICKILSKTMLYRFR